MERARKQVREWMGEDMQQGVVDWESNTGRCWRTAPYMDCMLKPLGYAAAHNLHKFKGTVLSKLSQ